MDERRNDSYVFHSPKFFRNTSTKLEAFAEEGLVDKETSKFIINVSSCGLVPVITILGIIGNVLSFVVFLRQRKRDRTRVILIGLAISDTLFLLTIFVRKLSCIVSIFDETSGHNWGQLMIPQGYVIGVTFARITSVLTMIISVERCFAALCPLKVRATITRKRALKTVVAIFVMVIVLMFPLTLTATIAWVVDPAKNVSVARMKWTDFYIRNQFAMKNYIGVALPTLLRLIPCVVVLFCTVSVLVSLKQGQKFRKQSSTFDLATDERRITVMLLAVTTLYIVCLIPGTVFAFVQRFVPGFNHAGTYVHLFMLLSNVNIVLECINSSLNFVIYMKMNKRFKLTFKRIVCGICTTETTTTDDPSVSAYLG